MILALIIRSSLPFTSRTRNQSTPTLTLSTLSRQLAISSRAKLREPCPRSLRISRPKSTGRFPSGVRPVMSFVGVGQEGSTSISLDGVRLVKRPGSETGCRFSTVVDHPCRIQRRLSSPGRRQALPLLYVNLFDTPLRAVSDLACIPFRALPPTESSPSLLYYFSSRHA